MEDRATLEQILSTARMVLGILEQQAAGYTNLTIPAHLKVQLEDKRQEVTSLEARLSQLQGRPATLPDNLPRYDVNLQPQKANREFNRQVTQLQPELERKRNEPTTHRLPESKQKEVFISYTHRDEHSKLFVEQLEKAFQAKGIKIIRDKNEIGYKERFQEFMQRLSCGKSVIVVISDQYLKSENCMYELVEIAKNGKLYNRIFPIVLADAQIYKPIERIKYIKYWEEEIKELDQAMKEVSGANLHGFREEIDLYTEIRNMFAPLTNLLKDMNTLTPDIHIQSEFEALLKAIEDSLDE